MSELFIENILPIDSWSILESVKSSVLIDVREINELLIDGIPNLRAINKNVIHIPWRITEQQNNKNTEYYQYINKNFLGHLKNIAYDTTIIFMCRGGARSREATIFSKYKGYKKCYNLMHGFNVDNNDNCWKKSGLPWKEYDNNDNYNDDNPK